MYIGFEIDGLISTPVKSTVNLEEMTIQTPIEGAREVLETVRSQGHKIIVYTKRDVSTALETEAWLSKNKMPYDQIIFNRPTHMVISFSRDFRQFISWKKVAEELINEGILKESEKSLRDKTIQAELPKTSGSDGVQHLKK